jgi:hypothetical protein
MIRKLNVQQLTVQDVATLRKLNFIPQAGVSFNYIEIGDVTQDGEAVSKELDGSNAPSRAVWHV